MSLQQLLPRFAAALTCAIALAASPAWAADSKEGSFTTSDGVRLHYIEAGTGDVLVMIPGWSQTAAQFKHQIAGLSDRYRVIALDMRGHGDSDKPTHGYRIHRLSADVHEFIVANNLKNVTLAGHSMGCSVIWGYWELFGRDPWAYNIKDNRAVLETMTRYAEMTGVTERKLEISDMFVESAWSKENV